MSREFSKMLAPLVRRLRLMASRAVLQLLNDATGIQVVQVKLLDGEVSDGVERFQDYGFTGNAPAGAEGVMLSLGADRAHGVVVVLDHRAFRLKALETGEVAVYDDQGQKVHLTRDGIVIHTAKKCRIEAMDIELHASRSWSWDVNGFGERWTYIADNEWEHKTWQQYAVVTSVSLPINPPEGP
ncbi:MAG: phage baseplate assembly protein V [Rhodocyclaceae bacterium]|nr:phage baseplate assembly protein V [Rhodocyclaceae bacterium]